VRLFFVFIILLVFSSCDYFSFQRKKEVTPISSEVDVTSVDTPPSFGRCNSLIDKEAKTTCFYEEIHKAISENLQQETIEVRQDVDETIEVILRIHSDKNVSLTSMNASPELLKEIPDLKKIVEKAIAKLPEILPAQKEGHLVTSEYKLPIRIFIKK
jgi:hypothetical protein